MAEANASGNTPAANEAGTPPAGTQTPSQSGNEETVVLKKSEHDELQKKAAQASEAQSRADSLEVENRKLNRPGARKVEAPTPFEASELSVIKSKVTATLLTNSDYRELIGKKPELARILAKDPTGILDTNEFADADDAISQVFDYLDEQVVASKSSAAPTTPANPPAETPPASAPANSNPANGQPTKTPEQMSQEEFDKLPPMARIQAKIAGKIGVK